MTVVSLLNSGADINTGGRKVCYTVLPYVMHLALIKFIMSVIHMYMWISCHRSTGKYATIYVYLDLTSQGSGV